MSSSGRTTEDGLRGLLLVGVGLGLAGAVAELALMAHWETPIQLVPFVLGTVGAASSLLALVSPSRPIVLALRTVLVLVVLGGAFGVVEHFEHNYEFTREIRPTATAREALAEAPFGANPVLAPGMLVWMGLLGLGATWRHRALQR